MMTADTEKALLAMLDERIEQARCRGKSTTIELIAATHRADMLALATLEPKPKVVYCECSAPTPYELDSAFCYKCQHPIRPKPEPKRGVEEILAEVLCHDRLQAYFPHIREHIYDALRLYREERERVERAIATLRAHGSLSGAAVADELEHRDG